MAVEIEKIIKEEDLKSLSKESITSINEAINKAIDNKKTLSRI